MDAKMIYIVELFTDYGHKIFFIETNSRAEAVKTAKAHCKFKSIKPAKARCIPQQTANDMLDAGKFDMTDLRSASN